MQLKNGGIKMKWLALASDILVWMGPSIDRND